MPSTVLYLLNKTDGSNAFVIQPGTFDGAGGVQRNTDLTLYGNGAPSWGDRFDENFYRLMEHFAVGEQSGTLFIPQDESTLGDGFGINRPIVGQMWFNTTRDQYFSYTGPGTGSQGWAPINNVVVANSSLTPTAIDGDSFIPRTGELVFNAPAGALVVFNGTNWVNAAGTVVTRILPGTGINVSPAGGTGNVTISVAGSSGTVSSVGVTATSGATGAAGLTVSGSPITTSGVITLTLSQELTGLSQLSSSGIVVRTGTGTYVPRQIQQGTGIVVTNSTGVTGNPIVSVGIVGIANGGTSATSAVGARTNLLPSQAGNSGRYLQTNGSDVSWEPVPTSAPQYIDPFTVYDSGIFSSGIITYGFNISVPWSNFDATTIPGIPVGVKSLIVECYYTSNFLDDGQTAGVNWMGAVCWRVNTTRGLAFFYPWTDTYVLARPISQQFKYSNQTQHMIQATVPVRLAPEGGFPAGSFDYAVFRPRSGSTARGGLAGAAIRVIGYYA